LEKFEPGAICEFLEKFGRIWTDLIEFPLLAAAYLER
jgi:hypothetical protein